MEAVDPGAAPTVSVIMPIRNEADRLCDAVASVLTQDYPRSFEVVLAVGPSDDRTAEIAAGLASDAVRVVDNPSGRTPSALNAAIAASVGEVVVRVDGHATLSPGYISRAVATLIGTGADNVGGVQRAEGVTPFEQAVAAAMTSKFGVGDAKFHYGGEAGPTDTVYLGVFRRSALERVGGFDETLIRNQDYELNWRIRDTGGVVWFDPELSVTYRPRSSLPALARQYYEYGWWKAVVLRRHPRSVRWRQLVPPAALIGNVGGVMLALAGRRRGLVVPGAYLSANVAASVTGAQGLSAEATRWLPAVFATMHHAWAAGLVAGAAAIGSRP